MEIRIISCKCMPQIFQAKFHFMLDKAYSNVHEPPNVLVKYCAILHNSESSDTGKETREIINASLLKLLCRIRYYCNWVNSTGTFLDHTDFNGEWVSKIHIFLAWLRKSLYVILKLRAKESIIQYGHSEKEHLLIHPNEGNSRKKNGES
jgi:hypothetical protein